MNASWKREGYSDVSAYLVADGAQRVIEFMKKTFDATALRRFDGPDGKIMHAEMRIGDTVVMIADGGGAYPAFPVWLHVYVRDVDATYKRALEAGGVAVQEPVRRGEEPDRRAGVKDMCGNTWWMSTQVG